MIWAMTGSDLHSMSPACVDCTSLGYAPSLIEFVFDTTRAVTHLARSRTLERCPNLRLIVPHAGGTIPYLVERVGLIPQRPQPKRKIPSTDRRDPS